MKNNKQPLSFLSIGQEAVIKDILGGQNLRHRLTEMGFAVGTKIHLVQNDSCGPLIISLGGGRIAIGRGMAQKIIVEREAS